MTKTSFALFFHLPIGFKLWTNGLLNWHNQTGEETAGYKSYFNTSADSALRWLVSDFLQLSGSASLKAVAMCCCARRCCQYKKTNLEFYKSDLTSPFLSSLLYRKYVYKKVFHLFLLCYSLFTFKCCNSCCRPLLVIFFVNAVWSDRTSKLASLLLEAFSVALLLQGITTSLTEGWQVLSS